MIAFVCSECVTAIYGPTVKEPNMWSIFRLNFYAHYFFFLMQKNNALLQHYSFASFALQSL